MKKVLIINLFCIAILVYAVTVDGYAFLEDETDHSGIQVNFQKVAPDTLYSNTVYTDAAGYYSAVIENGWFDVSYSKTGFIRADTIDVSLYSDQTLPTKTLSINGLSGAISGVLSAGEYIVEGDLTVQNGDSLIIEPGVELKFPSGVSFFVYGYLEAIGSVEDSIKFNPIIDDWNGIAFSPSSNGSMKYCSINKTTARAIGIDGAPINISNSDIFTLADGIRIYMDGGVEVVYDFNYLKITGSNTANSKGIISEPSQCTFNNCEITGFDIGMELSYCTTKLYNITILSNTYGILAWDYILHVYNSTIIDSNGGLGIGICYDAINVTEFLSVINSNIFGWKDNYFNCGDYIGINVTTNANADSCDAYGNISLDPMFVDAANGNFRLQADSPCIDSGINTISGYTFPEFDLDGNTRIFDGNNDSTVVVDMGPYEYFEVISPPDSPSNVTILVISNTLTINWDSIPAANSYLIYHSDEPYGTFELIDSVGTNTWNITIDANTKKFYQVVSNSDALK